MNSTNQFSPKFFRRVPLRLVIVIPFAIQLTVAVGITGWLSWRNGQAAVEDLVKQLHRRTGEHISHYLEDKLTAPKQINQLNLQAIELDLMKLEDFDRIGQVFWRQMQLFNVGYINFASSQGEFIGIERLDDESFVANETLTSSLSDMSIYQLSAEGERLRLQTVKTHQPPVYEEDWYADAAKVRKPTWSNIYQWHDKPEVLSISLSYPVVDDNDRLMGVLGVDLILSDIDRFLQETKVSPSALTFIVERNGLLVSSSSTQPNYKTSEGQVTRLSALESQDPLIRSAIQHLGQQFGNLTRIQSNTMLDFTYQGNREFMFVMPWQDEVGLDWLIVVVVPEADFMEQIDANTRTTILFCLLALTVTILLGLMTARWLSYPICRIAEASRAIASGQPAPTIREDGAYELKLLSQSFNQMATQIRYSLAELESRVTDRTIELAQARDVAEVANRAKSEFLAQVSHELRTPLNAIIGFAQTMESDPTLSLEQRNRVASIHRNGNALLSLINQILNLSRLDPKQCPGCRLDQTLAPPQPPVEQDLQFGNTLLYYYLAQMSSEWIEELHQAAVKGSDDTVLQLVNEIPPAYKLLADILKNWTENFHFHHIISVLNELKDEL